MSKLAPLKERLLSPLPWHLAGASVLLILVIGLAIRFGLDWAATSNSSTDALASKQMQIKALELQIAPLRGLDKRVDKSRQQMLNFYAKRIPANYSTIADGIGDLEVKSPVQLTRVQYAQAKPGVDLTEITLDASITGNYTGIMHFINGMERSANFFVIRSMALTGEQGGRVGLRLSMSTWMRAADAAVSGLPTTAENADNKEQSNSPDSTKDSGGEQNKPAQGNPKQMNPNKGGK